MFRNFSTLFLWGLKLSFENYENVTKIVRFLQFRENLKIKSPNILIESGNDIFTTVGDPQCRLPVLHWRHCVSNLESEDCPMILRLGYFTPRFLISKKIYL